MWQVMELKYMLSMDVILYSQQVEQDIVLGYYHYNIDHYHQFHQFHKENERCGLLLNHWNDKGHGFLQIHQFHK